MYVQHVINTHVQRPTFKIKLQVRVVKKKLSIDVQVYNVILTNAIEIEITACREQSRRLDPLLDIRNITRRQNVRTTRYPSGAIDLFIR